MLALMTATDEQDAGRTGKTLLGIQPRETFEAARDRLAAIDQRETARVEAIVQTCRLFAADSGGLVGTDALRLLLAIQHDSATDREARVGYVEDGLFVLARRWHELPVDARTVIAAGLVPDGRNDTWDDYVQAVVRFDSPTADRLLTILCTAILEETPTDV